MAQTKRKGEWDALQPVVTGNVDRLPSAPSPARALQQMLDEHTAPEIDRWSPRRTLALVVSASAALWLAIIAVVHGIFTLVA